MQIISSASSTVRNKNLLIVALCGVFLVLFVYDGWYGWPKKNDEKINFVKANLIQKFNPADVPFIEAWPGYNNASFETREAMFKVLKDNNASDGWKTDLDIKVQQYIAFGLIPIVGLAIWWFIHCQKRRAIATDTHLSPAPGVEIPWEKITIIDNTRWDKSGIVDVTYLDAEGKEQTAKLDDYETQREPLIEILELMQKKAVNARNLPEDEPAPEVAPKA